MKQFQALAVVKQPVSVMWVAVRDRMPDLAAMVDDVDSITLIERTDLGEGRVRLINEWEAAQRIPELLAKPLKVSTVRWVDTAVWDSTTMVCTWSIQPLVFPDHIDCRGTTTYESAMGGRGTRVTFQGSFDLAPGALGGLAKPLERPVGAFVESIISTMIPKNTRKIIEAAAAQLAAEA
jgi:hypothetical protein